MTVAAVAVDPENLSMSTQHELPPPPVAAAALARMLALPKRRCGPDFSQCKPGTVQRHVVCRPAGLDTRDPACCPRQPGPAGFATRPRPSPHRPTSKLTAAPPQPPAMSSEAAMPPLRHLVDQALLQHFSSTGVLINRQAPRRATRRLLATAQRAG